MGLLLPENCPNYWNIRDNIIYSHNRMAVRERERVSSVPARYRVFWNVYEFEWLTADNVSDFAAWKQLSANGKTFRYTYTSTLAKNISKSRAIKMLENSV